MELTVDEEFCELLEVARALTTNTRCTRRWHLENDHVIAKAKGGSDEIHNRRLLCKAHNLLEAERAFGKEKIRSYARR